jgi:hypothetical protein
MDASNYCTAWTRGCTNAVFHQEEQEKINFPPLSQLNTRWVGLLLHWRNLEIWHPIRRLNSSWHSIRNLLKNWHRAHECLQNEGLSPVSPFKPWWKDASALFLLSSSPTYREEERRWRSQPRREWAVAPPPHPHTHTRRERAPTPLDPARRAPAAKRASSNLGEGEL